MEVTKESVAGEAPPRSLAAFERFWRCARCRKLFWRGTHWTRIAARLGALGALGARGHLDTPRPPG